MGAKKVKKRILMISHVDLSRDDAPKVHFSNLAREFKKTGANVMCILYNPLKSDYEPIGEGVRVHFVPNPLSGNIVSRALKYILVIPFIIFEFLKFKPNLIYFRFSPPVFLYLCAIKGLRILPFSFRVILEFDDWLPEQRAIQGESPLKVTIIKNLQMGTARLADYIRVVVPGIKKKLLLYGVNDRKIAVIGNGTDTEHFYPMEKREAKKLIGVSTDFLYVGFIGNFAIWQGLDYLVAAIPRVLEVCNNVRFLLVGDGPEMPKIQKEISQFKNKEVLLTGRVSYKEAGRYINAFDIGVAPFIYERNANIGLSPLKIWDYAACGVPIIASRIKGLEVIEEENIGILVQPDDPEALADAIIELINSPKMRGNMGKRGRKVAEEKFTWKKIAERILQLVF